MSSEILQALLVGIIAAIPAGPILVMVIQRTLCHGLRSGRAVGLGAAVGDMVLAGVGVLTLELVRGYVRDHQGIFLLAGGVILGAIGAGMFFLKVPMEQPDDAQPLSAGTCFLQAFTTTLSNPAALAAMLALLTAFRLGSACRTPAWLIAPLVGAGEALYWWGMTLLLHRCLKVTGRTLHRLSQAAGALIGIFAAILLVRGILTIIGN